MLRDLGIDYLFPRNLDTSAKVIKCGRMLLVGERR